MKRGDLILYGVLVLIVSACAVGAYLEIRLLY